MSVHGEAIVVSSLNCRGLQDKKKKVDVLDFLKTTNSNIICLQDTHWTKSDERNIKTIWNHCCIIHGLKSNARGVAILINNKIEYELKDIYKDTSGNLLSVDLLISGTLTIRLINIYGPNLDTPDFYREIENLINSSACDYQIVCGDYNLVLNPIMDTMNYKHLNNPHARDAVIDIMKRNNLVDAFRLLHPALKRYSWRKKNPIQQARLDYFLISQNLTDIVIDSKISPGYRSDHSLISLKIILNTFARGKGLWKFNCSLLKNIEYLNLVNATIHDEKLKYAVPVYNIDKISEIDDNDIQFTISNKTFFEMLLLRIRGETIRFSSVIQKKERDREQKLIDDINSIEIHQNIQNLGNLLQTKQNELQELRNTRLKGQMIRSRIQWLDEGERPTKYYCALENKHYIDKTIKKLNTGQATITDQKEILKEVQNYYKSLFSNKDNCLSDIDFENLYEHDKIRNLTINESNSIEHPLTLEEITVVIKKMSNNKSPGIDGFPADFYKVFWSKIKHFLFRSINEIYNTKTLSHSMKQCVITCLPKGDKPREYIKNWRPISLLNVSYKIISATISNRLKTVLNNIISNTQSGFLQDRYIGESTRLIYDIMHHCEHNNMNGLLMLIDFEKAFDSVSWKFLDNVLCFFNFGPYIRSWINILNSDITSTVC